MLKLYYSRQTDIGERIDIWEQNRIQKQTQTNDQETKAIKGIKNQSTTNGAEKLDIHKGKKLYLNLCLTLYTKTNLKMDPRPKCKTAKLLEENLKKILDMTPKI